MNVTFTLSANETVPKPGVAKGLSFVSSRAGRERSGPGVECTQGLGSAAPFAFLREEKRQSVY